MRLRTCILVFQWMAMALVKLPVGGTRLHTTKDHELDIQGRREIFHLFLIASSTVRSSQIMTETTRCGSVRTSEIEDNTGVGVFHS